MKLIRLGLLLIFFFTLLVFFNSTTQASHSWGNYHWGRINNPFTLKIGDNLSSNWDSYLATTSSDWNASSVLDTSIVPGLTTGKRCRATNGRIEVCNYKYGRNGWLGLAQIWVNGDHIKQGIAKVNDSYFNSLPYNTTAWKNLVMCQEIAHTFGLDHQDEDFSNTPLGTCMDYSNDPTLNQYPNQHDYDQLELIYSHLDSANTFAFSAPSARLQNLDEDLDKPEKWGKELKRNKGTALYERKINQKEKVYTFVIWVQNQ